MGTARGGQSCVPAAADPRFRAAPWHLLYVYLDYMTFSRSCQVHNETLSIENLHKDDESILEIGAIWKGLWEAFPPQEAGSGGGGMFLKELKHFL